MDDGQAQLALRVGIAGLGRCGVNLAAEFSKQGFPALAIDTSMTDLSVRSELGDDQKLYIDAGPTGGTGGSRSLGATCLATVADSIRDAIRLELGTVEVVLAVGGLGGGTGGNLSTLTDLIADAGYPVIAVGVLPAASDGYHAKLNALHAVQGLVDARFESLVFVDNDKLHAAFADAPIETFLASCNTLVSESFQTIRLMASAPGLVAIRSFEPQDLLRVLSGGGVTALGHESLAGVIDKDTMLQGFMDVVNQNQLLASEHELEDAVAIGSVFVAPEEILAKTPASVFEAYREEVALLTGDAVHHIGVYKSKVGDARLHVVVSGLAFPSRLHALLAELNSESGRMNEKRAAVKKKLKQLDLSGLDAMSMIPPPVQEIPQAQDDVEELEPEDVSDMAQTIPPPPEVISAALEREESASSQRPAPPPMAAETQRMAAETQQNEPLALELDDDNESDHDEVDLIIDDGDDDADQVNA